jgi:hypothetical protein
MRVGTRAKYWETREKQILRTIKPKINPCGSHISRLNYSLILRFGSDIPQHLITSKRPREQTKPETDRTGRPNSELPDVPVKSAVGTLLYIDPCSHNGHSCIAMVDQRIAKPKIENLCGSFWTVQLAHIGEISEMLFRITEYVHGLHYFTSAKQLKSGKIESVEAMSTVPFRIWQIVKR